MAEELKKAWLQHEGKTLDAEASKVEVVSVESVQQETKTVKEHKHEHKRVKVRLTLDVVVCGDCGVFLGVLLPQPDVNLNNVEET